MPKVELDGVLSNCPKGCTPLRRKNKRDGQYTYLLSLKTKGRTGARARAALQSMSPFEAARYAHQWWNDIAEGRRTERMLIPMPIRP